MVLKIRNSDMSVVESIGNTQNARIVKTLTDGEWTETLYFSAQSADYVNTITAESYVDTESQLYVVKELHISGDWMDVVAVLNYDELTGYVDSWNYIDEPTLTVSGLWMYLSSQLTGWTLTSSSTKTITRSALWSNYTGKSITPLEFIRYACKLFGCELKIDPKKREIHMEPALGSNRGCYFTKRLNLTKLDIDADSYSLVTRLYVHPRNSALNISSINTSGVGDYVQGNTYTTKIVCAEWIPDEMSDTYTTKNEVYAKALQMISELSKPSTAYSVSVLDLAYSNEAYAGVLDYDIGDTVILSNDVQGQVQNHRIVEMDVYPDNPNKNAAVLSSKPTSILNQIKTAEAGTQQAVSILTESVDAVKESLTGDDETVAQTRASIGLCKSLYSGSWTSGTQAISGSSNYILFQIRMSGQRASILAMRNGDYIRGIGGYSSGTPTITEYYFAATSVGDDWTLVACNRMQHTQSGTHGAVSNNTVSEIIGIM